MPGTTTRRLGDLSAQIVWHIDSPHCYAYAIGSSVNEQPGATNGRIPTKWNDVTDVGKSVEANLKKKDILCVKYPDVMQKYMKNHFMRQTDTGQWAEKHGIGGASVLWDVGMTPDNISWTLDNVPYYDSPIIYYAIGR